MIRELAANLVSLKKEFQQTHGGKSSTLEAIPASESDSFPIERKNLELLHTFAEKNPIYHSSHEKTIGGTRCIVYEGDINRYWLSSIGHASSRAPFSPTWMVSAYVVSLLARKLGFGEVVDVGSGDGRIAFCAKLLGMESFSIEIDSSLAELQKTLSAVLDFNPYCSDATSFDYSSLGLGFPAFVIGGLAQMGGTSLATGVMEKINSGPGPAKNGWVFTGTYSQKYPPDPRNEAGWGTLIEKNNLRVLQTVSLPTAWTFGEPDETPYVFAAPNGR